MSLRIRRGTNSQRTGITFDPGEIVYTTDTRKLYVGDGSTAGGVNVLSTSAGVGLTWNPSTQALDVTGGGGGGGGLQNVSEDSSPSLGGDLNLSTHDIFGTGNINITGTLKASLGLGGGLDLNTYNITGVGNINISGGITATSFAGNVLATDNSSLLNNTTKTLTVNNIAFNAGFGSITGPAMVVETTNTNFIRQGYGTNWITFLQNQNVTYQANPLTFVRSRGTTVAPTAIQTNDQIINLATAAFTGTAYVGAGSITCEVTGTVSATAAPATWYITASDASGVINPTLAINSEGVVANRYIRVGNYTTTQVNAISGPAEGMIVFDTTLQKFKGYVIDTGLAAGGPPNSTPGWVNLN